MNKKYKYLYFNLFVALMLFLCDQPTKAVDICASKSLNIQEMADEDCPKVCAKASCCKKDGWSGNWLNFKAGMKCRWPNGAQSVCGCINTSCCNACDNAGIPCTLNCAGDAGCLLRCSLAWKGCQYKCGGCPTSEEEKQDEEKVKKEVPSALNSSSSSESKKPSDHKESPESEEIPNHQEHSSKS